MRITYVFGEEAEREVTEVVGKHCQHLQALGWQASTLSTVDCPGNGLIGASEVVKSLRTAAARRILQQSDAVVATDKRTLLPLLEAGLAAVFYLGDARQAEGRSLRVSKLTSRHIPCLGTGTEGLVPRLLEGINEYREWTSSRQTISLCLTVRDEEHNLKRCIGSAEGLVDEVVVVDTGSSDGTVEVARSLGARTFHYRWQNDFAAARNVALERAIGDWILVLDADEYILPGTATAFLRGVQNPYVDAYMVEIVNLVGPSVVQGAVVSVSGRLFRNSSQIRWEGPVHEQVFPSLIRAGGSLGMLTGASLVHLGYLQTTVSAQGKMDRNLVILKEQEAADPTSPFVHYNVGVEFVRRGELARALKCFQRAFRLLPGLDVAFAPALVRYLASTLLDLGRPEETIRVLRMVSEAYPEYTDIYYLAGQALNRLQRYGEASTMFEKALELGDAPAVFMAQVGAGSFLARVGLAESMIGSGRVEEALAVRRQADEEWRAMLERMGSNAWGGSTSSGVDTQRADQEFLRLVLDGEAKLREGDARAALTAYRQAMELPTPRRQEHPLWERKMVLELLVGSKETAEQDAAQIGRLSRRAGPIMRALLEGWEERQWSWPAGLEWDDVAAIVSTLVLSRDADRLNEVVGSLAGCMEVAQLELGLGKLLFHLGQHEEAARLLLRCGSQGAADGEAWWQLGEISRLRGFHKEGRSFFREAVRRDPQKGRYWISLALAYQAAGRGRYGLRVIDMGLRRCGSDAMYATRMGLQASLQLRQEAGRVPVRAAMGGR